MTVWMPMAGAVLDELVRRDGRGDFRKFDRCLSCPDREQARPATIRCTSCDAGPLECEECALVRHRRHACHRLMVSFFFLACDVLLITTSDNQRWNGQYFEVTSLKEIGLVVQLGHADGSLCSNPNPAPADFCVIDINGQYNLNIQYCGCDKAAEAGTHYEQLLRRDYYPSTLTDTHTAYTVRLLEHYHILSLQGKVSMYDQTTPAPRSCRTATSPSCASSRSGDS